MARYGNGMVEQGVVGGPTPRFLPLHTTVPMGPHPPNTAGRPQGACGLALVPRPTWRMPTARPTHHAPPRPTGAAHPIHSGAGMVHKAAPTSCTTELHALCPPQSSRVYGAPGENIAAGRPRLSRDVPPWSCAHMGPAAVVLHQVMGGEISRPLPLSHCRRPRGTGSFGNAISRPAWFPHQRAVLGPH